MGTSKALLEWHGSTLVRRVGGIVGRVVDGPVICVRAPGQALPRLPQSFEVVDDQQVGRGPLGGLAVGLAALAGKSEIAYVSSTDVPMLHPAFVRLVVAEVDDDLDACVPYVRGFRQPLAAAYRVELAPRVQKLLDADRLRPAFLLEECRWSQLDEERILSDPEVARCDPNLDSVTNLNEPADYEAARTGPAPEVIVERFGVLRAAGEPPRRRVRAATLGGAAEALGTPFTEGIVAAFNGDRISRDPEEPLVEGDVISFISADAGG